MLTGDIRNQVDDIWSAFWKSGIANLIEVMEVGRLHDSPVTSIHICGPDAVFGNSTTDQLAGIPDPIRSRAVA